jgi:hypothetical protein
MKGLDAIWLLALCFFSVFSFVYGFITNNVVEGCVIGLLAFLLVELIKIRILIENNSTDKANI